MIVDALVSTVLGFLGGLLGLVPSWGVITPTDMSAWGGDFGRGLQVVDGIVPVAAIVEVLGISLTIWAAFSLYDLALFIYHQVWGSS